MLVMSLCPWSSESEGALHGIMMSHLSEVCKLMYVGTFYRKLFYKGQVSYTIFRVGR